MATVIRKDGLHFIIQAYREVLPIRKKSLMVRDVKQLTEQNGQFLRLFKKGEKNLEAVFSKEPGFLLAEIIREHFGHPENLLVCEALPDGKILKLIVQNQ